MITEREMNLMRGWDRLSISQKKLIQYLMKLGGSAEGSQASIGRSIGDNQPANMLRSVKGLVENGIIEKEFISSMCIRLSLAKDYDEAIVRLGE